MTRTSPSWHGTLTALVTPMNAQGALDLEALTKLVQWQIDEGVDGLVACGTTGESATLSLTEWQQVVGTVVRAAAGRVPVMAGAGTQSTDTTIEAVRRARDCGAQGALVVTPFYNKPTQTGLQRHYEAVADKGGLPIMLYNVPSRTACDLLPATVAALAAHDNIVGLKDATADLRRLSQHLMDVPEQFVLSSGDDPTACAFTLMGGHGVISVASNVVPKAVARMIHGARAQQVAEARKAHQSLYPLMTALGLETNPLPVKTALAMHGRIQEIFRAPLCAMQAHNKEALRQALD